MPFWPPRESVPSAEIRIPFRNMHAVEIRGAKPGELAEVHAMLERAFTGLPRSFFDRRASRSPGFRPGHTRVLLLDGRIVSCARVYFRTVYIAGEPVLCGGLGDVGTDPEFRGMGFSTRCIENALQCMEQKGAPLSMLFTHIQPFYSRLGYFPVRTSDLAVNIPKSGGDIRCRNVDLKKDLPALKKLYDSAVRGRTGPLHRTGAYWKKQADFPNLDPAFFWIGEKKGRAVCYARGNPAKDRLHIREFAFAPGMEQALFSLLSVMARLTNGNVLFLPFVSEREERLFGPWMHSIQENTRWMVKLIDLKRREMLRELFNPGQALFWDSDRF